MENHNTKLLNFIYENAEMGVASISHLLETVEDENFLTLLRRQLEKYKSFLAQTEEHIKMRGAEVKHVSKVTTTMSDMMIDFKTMLDASPSKISQMMMQGTTMGIINAIKIIKENSEADKEIIELANKLLDFENKQFKNLKAFL